jgi:hypothetical protein
VIAARAKANYQSHVGRPKKSCQTSDAICKIDTKREIAAAAGVSRGDR